MAPPVQPPPPRLTLDDLKKEFAGVGLAFDIYLVCDPCYPTSASFLLSSEATGFSVNSADLGELRRIAAAFAAGRNSALNPITKYINASVAATSGNQA